MEQLQESSSPGKLDDKYITNEVSEENTPAKGGNEQEEEMKQGDNEVPPPEEKEENREVVKIAGMQIEKRQPAAQQEEKQENQEVEEEPEPNQEVGNEKENEINDAKQLEDGRDKESENIQLAGIDIIKRQPAAEQENEAKVEPNQQKEEDQENGIEEETKELTEIPQDSKIKQGETPLEQSLEITKIENIDENFIAQFLSQKIDIKQIEEAVQKDLCKPKYDRRQALEKKYQDKVKERGDVDDKIRQQTQEERKIENEIQELERKSETVTDTINRCQALTLKTQECMRNQKEQISRQCYAINNSLNQMEIEKNLYPYLKQTDLPELEEFIKHLQSMEQNIEAQKYQEDQVALIFDNLLKDFQNKVMKIKQEFGQLSVGKIRENKGICEKIFKLQEAFKKLKEDYNQLSKQVREEVRQNQDQQEQSKFYIEQAIVEWKFAIYVNCQKLNSSNKTLESLKSSEKYYSTSIKSMNDLQSKQQMSQQDLDALDDILDEERALDYNSFESSLNLFDIELKYLDQCIKEVQEKEKRCIESHKIQMQSLEEKILSKQTQLDLVNSNFQSQNQTSLQEAMQIDQRRDQLIVEMTQKKHQLEEQILLLEQEENFSPFRSPRAAAAVANNIQINPNRVQIDEQKLKDLEESAGFYYFWTMNFAALVVMFYLGKLGLKLVGVL